MVNRITCFSKINKTRKHIVCVFNTGAARQIRTADLVITNDVLCQLSYNSAGDPEGARTLGL